MPHRVQRHAREPRCREALAIVTARTRRAVAPVVAIICALATSVPAARADDGAPDRAFGTLGHAFLAFSTSAGPPRAPAWTRLLVTPAGPIYAVGSATFGTGPGANTRIVVARYTSAGRLDRTFAGRGFALYGVPGSATADAVDAVLLPRGDVVIAAWARFDPAQALDDRIVLTRIIGEGTDTAKVNPQFGVRGFATVDPLSETNPPSPTSDRPVGLALTRGGQRLVAVGSFRNERGLAAWLVASYDLQGQPVDRPPEYGTGHVSRIFNISATSNPGGITPYLDGAMVSLEAQPDPNFGPRGLAVVALDNEGSPFKREGAFANGSPACCTDHRHRFVAIPEATAVTPGRLAMTPRERAVVVVGGATVDRESRTVVARFDALGGVDRSFSQDGLLTLDLPGNDRGADVAVLPDGRILIASVVSTGSPSTALIRLLPDGELDTTFGGDGIVLHRPDGSNVTQSRTLAIAGDDVLAGGSEVSAERVSRFALTRFTKAPLARFACGPVVGCASLTPVARTLARAPAVLVGVEPSSCQTKAPCEVGVVLEVSRVTGGASVPVGRVRLGTARGARQLRWNLEVGGRLLDAGRYSIRIRALAKTGRTLTRTSVLRLILRREKLGITPIPIP